MAKLMCIWQNFRLCVAGLALLHLQDLTHILVQNLPPPPPPSPIRVSFFTFFSFINKNPLVGYTYDYHTLKCCTKRIHSRQEVDSLQNKYISCVQSAESSYVIL